MENRTRRQKSVTKASSRYTSPGMSPREEKPKEKRPITKESDNSSRRSSPRGSQHEHAYQMNIEKTPQVSQLLVHFSEYYGAFILEHSSQVKRFYPKKN